MLDFISNIFKPAAKLIDELHVSEEEKGKLKNEFARMQVELSKESISLMKAEVSSDHWIVAAWRPMVSLLLFSLIMADGYGWAEAPAEVYNLAEIFLTAYAGGRSLEKAAKVFKS